MTAREHLQLRWAAMRVLAQFQHCRQCGNEIEVRASASGPALVCAEHGADWNGE